MEASIGKPIDHMSMRGEELSNDSNSGNGSGEDHGLETLTTLWRNQPYVERVYAKDDLGRSPMIF